MTLAVAVATLAGIVAATAASGGPDYVGIAAVITAISGLIGTIGMLVLTGMRQRNEERPRRRK